MTVRIPHDLDPDHVEQLKAQEKERALELQRDGRWLHLWRVAGRYENYSVFEVPDHDALHALLLSLPLFPYLSIDVTALATHSSALTVDAENGS